MIGWPQRELAELGRIVTGKTPPTKVVSHYGGSTPFVTPTDMDGSRFVDFPSRTLSDSGVKSVANAIIPQGSVMVTCIASLGKVAIAAKETVTNQQINSIVPSDDIDSKFLYYSLVGIEPTLRSIAAGSVQPIVNKTQFGKIKITVPPLEEQRRIAHILGTLDDKIELNRQMNKTLDEIARTLFRSWFVDFDPVRSKMEGRQPDGMDAATAALFPDRLVDSELGPIPKGWEWGDVGTEFEVTMGQSPPGSTYNETGEGLPFYQGRTDFGFRYPTQRVFCTAPTRIANAGDTLISVRAPVGDSNLLMEKSAIGRGVAAFRHRCESESYTYHAIGSLSGELNRYNGEGTVFGSINQKDLRGIKIISPSDKLILRFHEIVSPCDSLVESNEKESRLLKEMSGRLIPALIGEKL